MTNAKRLAKRIYDQDLGERTATPLILDTAKRGGVEQ